MVRKTLSRKKRSVWPSNDCAAREAIFYSRNLFHFLRVCSPGAVFSADCAAGARSETEKEKVLTSTHAAPFDARKLLLALAIAASSSAALSACNTVDGAGKDIENTGEAIQDS